MALEPQWRMCGADWASCDLVRSSDGKRLQIKQSAARQTWQNTRARSRPRYSIAHKTGRWEGATWVAERGRNADAFVFAWHPVTDETADHRDAHQWLFYVVAEAALPDRASISLATIEAMAKAVPIADLKAAVRSVLP